MKYNNTVLAFSRFQSTQDRLILHKENSHHNSDGMFLPMVARMVRMMAVFVVVVVVLLLLMPMVVLLVVVLVIMMI